MMNQIMLDIETLAASTNAVIVSIAAVKFSFSSDETQDFQVNCDPVSGKSYGMIVEKDTIEWWMRRPAEVRNAWKKDPQPLEVALDKLTEFIGPNWKNNIWWCQGASFDYPILQWNYKTLNKNVPWFFPNLRDTRTIYNVFDLDMKTFPRVGDYHNSIDDCKTQIAALKACLV